MKILLLLPIIFLSTTVFAGSGNGVNDFIDHVDLLEEARQAQNL